VVRVDRFADLVHVETRPQPAGGPQRLGDPEATILVVDDTPEVRQLIGEILSEHSRVLYAADGEKGWEAVQRHRPDLVLSDVMMPRVDGYELCRRVKEDPATAAIPFMLLTARAQTSRKVEGLNIGADDYLVKPFNSDELLARVRALLRMRQLHVSLEEKHARLEQTLVELRETQSQLVHAEKMNSLGQLVAGIAHEINNAINAVCNGVPAIDDRLDRLQLLIDRELEEEAAAESEPHQDITQTMKTIRRLSSVVREGADRTARIVRDLKTFSHPGSETREPFDVNTALGICLALVQQQYQNIQVQRDYGRHCWVKASYGQLNQVFMNLMTNAAQAMPKGGDLEITTAASDGWLTISIRDTGQGIPEAIRHRIFDPFFTTKGPGKGTGLGLSISYGVVTRLGGTIECHSIEGVGTEFLIRLPALCDVSERDDRPSLRLITAGAAED
jgi:signal transduction histidine kinase